MPANGSKFCCLNCGDDVVVGSARFSSTFLSSLAFAFVLPRMLCGVLIVMPGGVLPMASVPEIKKITPASRQYQPFDFGRTFWKNKIDAQKYILRAYLGKLGLSRYLRH
jgi:hypothetical protein